MFRITLLVLISFGYISLKSQAPGIVIQTGLSAAYAKDENITKSKQAHYGWMVGADARLLEGDLYFIIGGQYHSTTLNSTSSPDFFGKKDWKILMARLGMGFNILHFSESMVLRSKILGSINFIMDSPAGGLNITGYKTINDSFLGATTGLGLTFGAFNIDLDYQYGIINAYYLQPKSKFDSWTLMAGFHF